MTLQRIKALVSRNLILNYRGMDPLTDIFYWPLFDIIIWGFTSKLLQTATGQQTSLLWLSGLIFWHMCYRANLDVSLNFLQELWSRNVMNLFATPLQLSDWIIGSMLLGIIDGLITFLYGFLLIFLLYRISLFSLGWIIVPLSILLIMSGWIIGFFTASWLIYYGQSKQKLVWVLAWFFLPFSAVLYPLEMLPPWIVTLAKLLPMAYAYEGLRQYLMHNVFPFWYLSVSFLLNCIYLTLSLLFFSWMFYKSRGLGLARLESE